MTENFRVPDESRNDVVWYNYGYDALDVSIESYSLNGGDYGTHGVGDEHLEVDDVEWSTVTLRGQVTVPDGLVDYIFEDSANTEEDGSLLVTGDCIATHDRFVAHEFTGEIEPGSCSFETTLKRSDVADEVKMSPILVREGDEDDTSEEYRYAQTPGLKLADGPTYTVEVDSREVEEDGAFLPIESKAFEESPPEDHVFYLDHSRADEPTLYVNSEVDLLVSALKSKAPHGPKRWTKEVLQKLIGQPVWVELVLWTAADVTDGEPAHDWQREVLTVLSEVMYEDEGIEEVATDLEDRVSDPTRLPLLLEEVNEAVQENLSPKNDVERLLDEVM